MTFSSSSRSVSVIVASSLLLLLVSMITVSQPMPLPDCTSTNETTDPAVRGHAEQVVNGIEIMIMLGSRLNGTMLNIPDIQSVSTIKFSIITCMHINDIMHNMLSALQDIILHVNTWLPDCLVLALQLFHYPNNIILAFQCHSDSWWSTACMSSHQLIS